MVGSVTIEEVRAEDKELILHMWESLTMDLPQHHFKPFGDPILPKRSGLLSDMFNNSVASPTATIFKIESDCCIGTIAAVLNQQTGFTEQNSGVIYNLWIEPEYRRSGFATALVEHAKQWLKVQGANSAQVGWHPDNIAADTFWKKLGFRNYEVIAASPL